MGTSGWDSALEGGEGVMAPGGVIGLALQILCNAEPGVSSLPPCSAPGRRWALGMGWSPAPWGCTPVSGELAVRRLTHRAAVQGGGQPAHLPFELRVRLLFLTSRLEQVWEGQERVCQSWVHGHTPAPMCVNVTLFLLALAPGSGFVPLAQARVGLPPGGGSTKRIINSHLRGLYGQVPGQALGQEWRPQSVAQSRGQAGI